MSSSAPGRLGRVGRALSHFFPTMTFPSSYRKVGIARPTRPKPGPSPAQAALKLKRQAACGVGRVPPRFARPTRPASPA